MKTLVFKMDNAGCGNYRVTLPYTNLSNTYKKDSFIIVDKNTNYMILNNLTFLQTIDNIVFQRPFSPLDTQLVTQLIDIRKDHKTKCKFKLIYESDDDLLSAPVYNTACIVSCDPSITDNLKYFDKFILSTPYMKKMFVDKYKVDAKKVHVFKNYVFKEYMYSSINYENKEQFTKRRKRILMAGSNHHFSRIKKLNGDYLENVEELMHYIINSNEYELCLIGTVPFFLYKYFDDKTPFNHPFDALNSDYDISIKEEYKDSLRVIEWTNFSNYFNLLKEIDPDFMIASLVDNDFNKCKSWIKQIEAYSLPKTVFLGNVFKDSPYEDQANMCGMFDKNTNLIDSLTISQDYDWFYGCIKNQKEYLENEKLFFSDRIEDYYNILKD